MGRLTAILMLLIASGTAWGAAVEVRGVRILDEGDQTRIEIDLGGSFTHKLFALDNPDRLVIDIPDAALTGKLPVAPAGHALLGGLRSGVRDGDDLRMVIDLKQPVRPKSFQLKPGEEGGHRLVVDLASSRPVERAAKAEPPKQAEPQPQPEAPAQTQPQTQGPKRLAVQAKPARAPGFVVAIDAGHGGKDAGALGAKGTKEKDITLAVARRLAKLVAKEPGMQAYLTRNTDTFVPLRQRMVRARKQNADLFVSIHADAFNDPGVRGSSVYTLSPRGASSEAAKWLADRENAADLVGGVKLDEGDGVLASVLLDMSQNATMEQSAAAADLVLDRLAGLGGLHKARVQRAGFLVLKSPDVPSMLVETAFISNPAEEARLRDPKHQQRLAEAILKGIRAYAKKYPGPTAGRGESLADVAGR